jgi:hypothetical protein
MESSVEGSLEVVSVMAAHTARANGHGDSHTAWKASSMSGVL